jgi:hypothetical protein
MHAQSCIGAPCRHPLRGGKRASRALAPLRSIERSLEDDRYASEAQTGARASGRAPVAVPAATQRPVSGPPRFGAIRRRFRMNRPQFGRLVGVFAHGRCSCGSTVRSSQPESVARLREVAKMKRHGGGASERTVPDAAAPGAAPLIPVEPAWAALPPMPNVTPALAVVRRPRARVARGVAADPGQERERRARLSAAGGLGGGGRRLARRLAGRRAGVAAAPRRVVHARRPRRRPSRRPKPRPRRHPSPGAHPSANAPPPSGEISRPRPRPPRPRRRRGPRGRFAGCVPPWRDAGRGRALAAS